MKRDSGFTLLEVMVALAITAGVILTLLTVFDRHLAVAARDREEAEAMLLARGKMEELAHEQTTPKAKEGTFAPERPDMDWRLEVEPTELPELWRVTVTVSWDGKRKELSLEQYR